MPNKEEYKEAIEGVDTIIAKLEKDLAGLIRQAVDVSVQIDIHQKALDGWKKVRAEWIANIESDTSVGFTTLITHTDEGDWNNP